MKKSIRICICVLCFCLSVIALCSCSKNIENDQKSDDGKDIINVDDVSVSYDENAADYSYVFYDDNNDSLKITDYKGLSQNIIIPSTATYQGAVYPVKAIGERAFLKKQSLVRIKISEGVTEICERAFSWCESVIEITVANTVTDIGFGAFNGCSKLQKLTIPFVGHQQGSNVDDYFGYIFSAPSNDKNASYTPSTLTEVCVTNATRLGDYAFNAMRKLKTVTLNEGLLEIGERAFFWCEGLEELTIPSTVTSYGDSALNGCSHLKKLTIPFLGDKKYSPKCTNIGYLFGTSEWKSNSSVMPSTLRVVELTNETKICSNAFYGLRRLENIIFNDFVSVVQDDAFSGCVNLKFNEYNNVGYLGSDSKPHMLAMTVYDKSVDKIELHPDTVSVYSGAISMCENVESLTLPNSVTTICSKAFYKNSALKEITIGDYVEKIGDGAFYDCKSLERINISNNSHLVEIGKYTFYNCNSLKSISIARGITKIGECAFLGANSLTDVYISSVEDYLKITLENNFSSPFYSCENLYIGTQKVNEIFVEDGNSILRYAFCYLKAVDKINIGKNIGEVERWAFYQMSDSAEINFAAEKNLYTLRIDYDFGFGGKMNFNQG